MPKLRSITKAERRQHEQPHQRAGEDCVSERRQAGDLIADDVDLIAAGGLKGEPGDQAGQRNAGGHVVVDADHIRAQAGIDRDLIGAIAGAGGRDIPVEVRHGKYPWVVPVWAGQFRPENRTFAWLKSNAKAVIAPDGGNAIFAKVTVPS